MIVSFCEFLDYSWGCNLLRRFPVSVRKITLRWGCILGGEGLPTSTMKFEPSRIIMIPQYLMVKFKLIEKLKMNFVAL